MDFHTAMYILLTVYKQPLKFSCIDVRISETPCPALNETTSSYLRDAIHISVVKTDEYGFFNITEVLDYSLSQNAK